jgi:APA family basic amino acid/polyamine antiporter
MNDTQASIAMEGRTGPEMRRVLGPWHLTAIGIGAIIGAGLFSLTGLAAGEDAGPAVILSYIIAAIPAALTGLCYAELAAMFPQSGSCYTYVRRTAGDLAGWIIGWDLILEYAVAAATVAAAFTGYANSLLGDYGLALPYWLLNGPFGDGAGGTPGIINLPAVLIILACSLLLLRGITESAWVNTIIVFVKLLVIVLFIVLGLGSIKAANYLPFVPPGDGNGHFGWGGVFGAAGTIFFAYIGFETVSTAAQESRNPQRDMPIGMLGSLVVCTLLYVGFAAVLVGLVPYEALKGDEAAAQTALAQTPYGWARPAIAIAILAGFSTSILTALYGQSRILAIMAAEGMLPRAIGAIHPRWRTPWISVLGLLVFTATLAGLLPLEALGDMVSIGTLLAFAAVSACVLVLRRTQPDLTRPFRVPFAPVLPLLGIVCCVGLMFQLDIYAWSRLVGWLVLGLLVRLLNRRLRQA